MNYRIIFYHSGKSSSDVKEIDPTQLIYARVNHSIYDIDTFEFSTTQSVPYLARLLVVLPKYSSVSCIGEYVVTDMVSTSTSTSVVHQYTAVSSMYYDLRSEQYTVGAVNAQTTYDTYALFRTVVRGSTAWGYQPIERSDEGITCINDKYSDTCSLWDGIQFITSSVSANTNEVIAAWVSPYFSVRDTSPNPSSRTVELNIVRAQDKASMLLDINSNVESITRTISDSDVNKNAFIYYKGSIDDGPSRLHRLEPRTSGTTLWTSINNTFGSSIYYRKGNTSYSYEKETLYEETEYKPSDVAGNLGVKSILEGAAKAELLQNAQYPIEYKVVLSGDTKYALGDLVNIKSGMPSYDLSSSNETVKVMCYAFTLDLMTNRQEASFGKSSTNAVPKIETRRSN